MLTTCLYHDIDAVGGANEEGGGVSQGGDTLSLT